MVCNQAGFEQQFIIAADAGPDGWHANLVMQAGKIGVADFEQYEWAVFGKEIEALCKPTGKASHAGAKRGRKPYDAWDLFHARCVAWLDSDDVAPYANVNVSELADRLMA